MSQRWNALHVHRQRLTARRRLRPRPGGSLSEFQRTGEEAIASAPYNGKADLPVIASALHMEVDDLFPVAEVLQMLGFALIERRPHGYFQLGEPNLNACAARVLRRSPPCPAGHSVSVGSGSTAPPPWWASTNRSGLFPERKQRNSWHALCSIASGSTAQLVAGLVSSRGDGPCGDRPPEHRSVCNRSGRCGGAGADGFICAVGSRVMIAKAGVGRIVAHFHYVMPRCLPFSPGGATGVEDQRFNALVVKLHFWLTFIRANVLFLPQHLLDRAGMVGRIANYGNVFAYWNWWSSIGAHVTGAYFASRPSAPSNPWGARATTLEWTLASPPPFHTFGTLPDLR